MIVTPGAAQCQPQKDLRRGADDVVKLIEPVFRRVGRLIVPRPQAVKAQCRHRFGAGVGNFVAGQLFENEPIVRLVVVEALDDVIAIAPHRRLGAVPLVSVRFGIANEVKPVPAPALAIGGPRKKLVNKSIKRKRRRILQKFRPLLKCGRQARDIQKHSP